MKELSWLLVEARVKNVAASEQHWFGQPTAEDQSAESDLVEHCYSSEMDVEEESIHDFHYHP